MARVLAAVAVLCCLVLAVRGQYQTAPKAGIVYSPACGLEDRNATWAAEWRLTLHTDNHDAFARHVTVTIPGQGQICQIDLDACGTAPAEDEADACYCKKQAGINYDLVVKRLARVEESEKTLISSLPFAGECHPQDLSKILGFLPPVYADKKEVEATFRLDDGISMKLKAQQTIAVCQGHYLDLSICVKNLMPDFTINVNSELQGWATSMTTECMDTDLKFDFRNHSSYDVVVTYTENTWCPRSGQYLINFVETDIECPPILCDEPTRTSCESGDGILKYHNAALPQLGGRTVLCDAETDGGNWTIIQKREDNSVDFYREYQDYRNGFGQNFTNFWLGLESIHTLCFDSPCELRVDMTYQGVEYYAKYNHFVVYGSAQAYKVEVKEYSGDAGDGLSTSDGMKFTTTDRDHDNAGFNCAKKFHGAWWYNNCGLSNLNGKYGSDDFCEGMNWVPLTHGYNGYVDTSEMKVRQPLAADNSGST